MKSSMDAKLRILIKSTYSKIAIFELPPHKRTVFVQNGNYFVQFPYLIFIIPYLRMCGNPFLINNYPAQVSLVHVLLRNNPISLPLNDNNILGGYLSSPRVCFGIGDNARNLYHSEKNLRSLFCKIADLYFGTAFLPFDYPFGMNDFYHWHSLTKANNLQSFDWERRTMSYKLPLSNIKFIGALHA